MKLQLAGLALLFATAGILRAGPLTFEEVSLLVRMRESETSVIQMLSTRHLLRALTPGQEARLKAQGASDALLDALRAPATILTSTEAVAFENWTAEQKKLVERTIAAEATARAQQAAAQAAAVAAWNREQEEKAALERARTEVAVGDASIPYAGNGGDYGYGSYPVYGFSTACPVGAISSPQHGTNSHLSRSTPTAALHWQNGSVTTHAQAGITYYPMGSNGSVTGPISNSPGIQTQCSGIRFGR